MRALRPGCALSWAVEDLADCLGEVFHRPVDLVSRRSRERYLFVPRTVLVSRENGTCFSRERVSVTGSRRDAITYGVNGTRSSCEDRGVSWVYWCGWGARATILFVGAGAAQDGIREAALESYAERLLLTSDLPRISGFTMRVCSGAVLRSLMTWSVSVLCPVREGVGLRPLAVGYGKMRVLCGTGGGPRRGARARRRGLRREDLARGCTCGCSRG